MIERPTMKVSVKTILSGCIMFILTACASSPAIISVPDPTSMPVPTENSPTNLTLYRGNPQRTGVFDFTAIRQKPSILANKD